MSTLGVVALFYSNVGAAGLLTKLLESAGFTGVSAPIDDASDRRSDIDALVGTHNPSVILYDIGRPFEDNWRRFQELRAQTSIRKSRFVITAVDAARVERLGSDDERIFEVVDKDSDLVAIVQAQSVAGEPEVREQRDASEPSADDRDRGHRFSMLAAISRPSAAPRSANSRQSPA